MNLLSCSSLQSRPCGQGPGMLQLLLEDKSKVGAAMMVRPKDRISYFTFAGEQRKVIL